MIPLMHDFSLQSSKLTIQVKTKVWLEISGHRLFGEGSAQLFRLIRETGSINASAKIMGISFRRAWGMVKDVEDTLGITLLEKKRGGIGGGMTSLNPAALELLERYEAILKKFISVTAP